MRTTSKLVDILNRTEVVFYFLCDSNLLYFKLLGISATDEQLDFTCCNLLVVTKRCNGLKCKELPKKKGEIRSVMSECARNCPESLLLASSTFNSALVLFLIISMGILIIWKHSSEC